MQARPYKLFAARERALLGELIEQKVEGWMRDWFPERTALRVDCAPAGEPGVEPADWLAFGNAAGEWWALAAGEDQIHALAAALCGSGEARILRSAIAAQAARAALQDLAAGLLGGAVSAVRMTPLVFGTGSASFVVRAALGEAQLRLVSSPQWTLRALKERLPAPPPAPLVARRQAIAAKAVELRVVAGWAELDLGELRALQAGDVIALDARIDRPMSVALGARALRTCGARLGLKDGRRAAALTAR